MFSNNAPRGVIPLFDALNFASVDYGLPLCFFTFLLYKYKPYYVNLSLHIGASVLLYLVAGLLFFSDLGANIKIFLIVFILQIPHLAFTLYVIIYACKFETQKIPFRKRLWQYFASFFIGIGLLIISCVIMFVIGYCIALMYYSNFSTPDYTQKDRYEAMKTMLFVISILFFITTLSLLSYILYKNHKSFFTKIFDRICAMIGKGKP